MDYYKFMNNKTRNDIKKVLNNCAADYLESVEKSRDRYVLSLQPGQTIPRNLGFYDDESRDAFKDRCREYREQVKNIINERRAALSSTVTKTPDPDAVNTLNVLKMTGGKTAADYEPFLEKYKNDPLSFEAVRAIANANGVHLDAHPVTMQLENIDLAAANIDRAITGAARRGLPAGFVAILGEFIDNAFPDPEE